MHQDAVLELVDFIYAAAYDSAQWPALLRLLSSTTRASGANFAGFDARSFSSQMHHGIGILGPDFQREYLASFFSSDPFLLRGTARNMFQACSKASPPAP